MNSLESIFSHCGVKSEQRLELSKYGLRQNSGERYLKMQNKMNLNTDADSMEDYQTRH